MVHILTQQYSFLSDVLAGLRDVEHQKNPLLFRTGMEHFAMICGYEISKTLSCSQKEIKTPLGVSSMKVRNQPVVVASILRAGIPMHDGLLKVFPDAGNAFIGSYRKPHKSHQLEIALDYVTAPRLENSVLIMADPMLATGKSVVIAIKELIQRNGLPLHIHIVSIIASREGVDYVKSQLPTSLFTLWCGAVDEELSSHYYIVPGLGDAGDLAYGPKI